MDVFARGKSRWRFLIGSAFVASVLVVLAVASMESGGVEGPSAGEISSSESIELEVRARAVIGSASVAYATYAGEVPEKGSEAGGRLGRGEPYEERIPCDSSKECPGALACLEGNVCGFCADSSSCGSEEHCVSGRCIHESGLGCEGDGSCDGEGLCVLAHKNSVRDARRQVFTECAYNVEDDALHENGKRVTLPGRVVNPKGLKGGDLLAKLRGEQK